MRVRRFFVLTAFSAFAAASWFGHIHRRITALEAGPPEASISLAGP